MQVSYNQKIVTITAHDPAKSTKFTLVTRDQLDELEQLFSPDEVASIDVELINDRESINGTTHRSVMTKHFDTLSHFIEFARRHYVM